jgi:crotonobetainyl-CoA:carnitine CoA-transferase CaiB-like acyl-CoA transferase
MLSGIKVIEISTLIAGPYCTMLLGDMGADVIKIEHPFSGDTSREMGPPYIGDQSCFYLSVNRNKKGLALDIGKEKGRDILLRLVERSDVIVENLRPDIVERMRIDYDSLSKINPKLIYCSITAFGEKGPYRMKPGTDTIFQGMGGIMTISGEEGDPPIRIGMAPADMSTGIFSALGVILALYYREKTGEGQKVSISLIDSLIAFQSNRIQEYLATGKNPVRTGKASPFGTPIEYFRTKDGYINISVFSDKFWRRFCYALGIEDLVSDPRFMGNKERTENRNELREILSRIFSSRTTNEWREILDKEDIPNGPIYSYSEMFKDPQILNNEIIFQIEHPTIGPLTLVDQPLRFSRAKLNKRSHPPMLGEHTDEILREIGISEDEIADLRANRIIS